RVHEQADVDRRVDHVHQSAEPLLAHPAVRRLGNTPAHVPFPVSDQLRRLASFCRARRRGSIAPETAPPTPTPTSTPAGNVSAPVSCLAISLSPPRPCAR